MWKIGRYWMPNHTQETNALCSVNSMGLANLHTHASLHHCTHVHAFACGLRPLLCGYVQISWRQRSISCAQINQNTVDKRGLAPWPYIFSWRCSSFARNTSDSRLSVRTFRLWMQSTSQPLRLLSELSGLFICLAIFETNCDTTYDMCRSVKSPWVSSSSFATNFGSKQCDVVYSCFAITPFGRRDSAIVSFFLFWISPSHQQHVNHCAMDKTSSCYLLTNCLEYFE